MKKLWEGRLRVDAVQSALTRRGGSTVGVVLHTIGATEPMMTYADDDVTELLVRQIAGAHFPLERLHLELTDKMERASAARALAYSRLTVPLLELDTLLARGLTLAVNIHELAWATRSAT